MGSWRSAKSCSIRWTMQRCRSTLLVEHELTLVEQLCDPVIVMAQGKVIAEGPMREVRSRKHVVDAYLAG